MITLEAVQRGFAAAVLRGGDPEFAGPIREDGLSPAERVAIYRNNTTSSFRAALAAIYPAIERLVGEAYFTQVARAYLRHHPSRSGNLHDFGERFPEFLGELPEMADLGYAGDVARIEWARHRAFHAANEPPFPLDRLAAIAPERHAALRFTLAGSASLVASRFPAATIWSVNQPEFDGDASVDLSAGSERAAIWRHAGEARVRVLGAGEHALLAAFAAGRPLAGAIDAARNTQPGIDAAARLREHVAAGLVGDFNP